MLVVERTMIVYNGIGSWVIMVVKMAVTVNNRGLVVNRMVQEDFVVNITIMVLVIMIVVDVMIKDWCPC